MIIFNTTFHIEKEVVDSFLDWLKEVYIPEALEGQYIHSPQLCKVLSQQEGEEGYSYSLQFKVQDTAILHKWFMATGNKLDNQAIGLFGHKVTKFSTLLEIVE